MVVVFVILAPVWRNSISNTCNNNKIGFLVQNKYSRLALKFWKKIFYTFHVFRLLIRIKKQNCRLFFYKQLQIHAFFWKTKIKNYQGQQFFIDNVNTFMFAISRMIRSKESTTVNRQIFITSRNSCIKVVMVVRSFKDEIDINFVNSVIPNQ